MNVFDAHGQIVDDYAQYIRSFINISDPEIARTVERSLAEGRLWPEPLLQFNPAYEQVGTIEEVAGSGLLHDDVRHIFEGYSLYRHQQEAIELGVAGTDFIVTSGTGSGKSLTYIGTIFNQKPHYVPIHLQSGSKTASPSRKETASWLAGYLWGSRV